MTTNGNDEFDKVRMSSDEEHMLEERSSYERDPEAIGIDVGAMMVSAITIEEALYKLANNPSYRVRAEHEMFMGEPIVSFYLINKDNREEKHWIVYKN